MKLKVCDAANNFYGLDTSKEYTPEELYDRLRNVYSGYREKADPDDIYLFGIEGYISVSDDRSTHKRYYYLEISDTVKEILNHLDELDVEIMKQSLLMEMSAFVGGKVRWLTDDADMSGMTQMYKLETFATEFAEDGQTLGVYGVLSYEKDVFEEYLGLLDDLPPIWSIYLELPLERSDAMIESVGLALEDCGEDDHSLLYALCKYYYKNREVK